MGAGFCEASEGSEGNLIIFGLSGNYADSRLFEKWTTLAAWQQLQQLLLPHYLSSPQKNKKEEEKGGW